MKKYIKSLAALFVLAVGFASCADDFDEDDKTSYPAEAPAIGVWVNDNMATEGDFASPFSTYEVNFSLNEAGDTLVNLLMWDVANGLFTANSGTIVGYDPVAGMTTVDFPSCDLGLLLAGQPLPARAYFTYSRDHKSMTTSIDLIFNGRPYSAMDYTGVGVFTVKQATKPAVIDGTWVSTDGNNAIQAVTNEDGTAIAAIYVGNNVVEGTPAYDRATGTLTITDTDGKAYTATFNEKLQLVLSFEGQEIVLIRA